MYGKLDQATVDELCNCFHYYFCDYYNQNNSRWDKEGNHIPSYRTSNQLADVFDSFLQQPLYVPSTPSVTTASTTTEATNTDITDTDTDTDVTNNSVGLIVFNIGTQY